MIYFISLVAIISIALNILIFQRWLKLAKLVLNHEVAIEECLDGINNVYSNVDKILQSPLATNDPKVTQIHRELKRAHEYILQIANRLTSGWSSPKEDIEATK